ncbi:DNA mismatch repair protein [Chitinophaga parva]|uniref:DNA mismatch repair protein n=1 Tax=Chitinophaga parva TaxID=2169414 RepID=A0A2T7BHM9_9BACT|nr:DNA mismatch repair protein [Chitinophaga parva]PUZ25789.1 DNA mismatch repair protein [Chitinophaga parva]
MLFTTDRQTLEDLNIFGKHGGDSVYNIFNRTHTRGGAALLEDMFRHPLSDPEAINRRSGIIQYFATGAMVFPFQPAQFDAIDTYLANTDERTKLQAADDSLAKRLGNLVAQNGETAMIYKGVQALVALLSDTKTFLQGLDIGPGHVYETEKTAMLLLLSEPGLLSVLQTSAKDKLSHALIAEYDVLLRFRHRTVVQQLLRHIAALDVYLSIARVATERGFAFPRALPAGASGVRLEGVYHPQVKGAVGNDITVTPEGNVLFLTGANMAGKSTFMKSLSIALFLAHMGFPVPAQSMEFAVLDGIYTTINLPDNLGMGASHFYAEVLRVKKMALELGQGKKLFIVFDELFRGTNVKDAYEATIAIVKAFARQRGSLFVISTHIIEAGEVLRAECGNVRFVFLPTRMDGHRPVYTYTLAPGITDDRHGMIIINNEGILDILRSGLAKK